MNSINLKRTLIATLPLLIALTFVLTQAPTAHASIKVEGDDAFTEEVEQCLDVYRNQPGLVGDVIKELEASEHEHKIIDDPSWSNTPNDESKAIGGSGVGTVTKVNGEKLEEFKKRFPDLEKKDFCTALLHELWHAVDADRGGWSNDTKDGVLEDEIEATIFQNFVHAIRGVEPRTIYGAVDISKHVVITNDYPEEDEIEFTMSYDHVKPGSFSEIYMMINYVPNVIIEAELTGPGVDSTPKQTTETDSSGEANLTWRIVSFGPYSVTGTAGDQTFEASVEVE